MGSSSVPPLVLLLLLVLSASSCFLLCLGAPAATTTQQQQRFLVKYDPASNPIIELQAQKLGLTVLGSAGRQHGLMVLAGNAQEAGSRAMAAPVQHALAKIAAWPGVQHVEEDQPRYLQRGLFSASAAQQLGAADCTARDKAAPSSANSLLPEYVPYGIPQIQADSAKLPTSIDQSGVMVCIIDSGVDAGHPDLSPNTLDGCKFEDSFAPGGCPFKWSEDFISHGSHVAGTIAAKADGRGIVGVIPNGAELYVVRVFNDSGDVNQGQGLVYGGTLILAFTQCEGRLAAMQSRFPERQYRMVVSMSLGAPGPLTIEQLFFREAVKRGDILFVGSSGNNGTTPTLQNGKLTSALNPGNFPGTYPEVISVAAVDCNNKLASFSQKHASVDISAPGVDILSTASRQLSSKAGMTKAAFRVDSGGPRFMTNAGIGGTNSQIRWSGVGQATGKVVDCGDGTKACPEAKGNICMVQWDPKMKNIDRSASSARATMHGRLLRWISGVAAAAAPRQRPADGSGATGPPPLPLSTAPLPPSQQPMPTRFTCDLMEFCLQQGAKAALLAAPAPSSGYYPDWGWTKSDSTGEPEFADWPFFANLKCTAYNCSCWDRLKGKAVLPAAGLTLKQYKDLKAAVKANAELKGTIESQPDMYQRLSGTSMAVPHVTGVLARVWADFPNCKSETVRKAIEVSAMDLGPKGLDSMYGHGLLQAEAAHTWLSQQPCAKEGFSDERGQRQQHQQRRQQQPQPGQQQPQPQQKPQGGSGGSNSTKPQQGSSGGTGSQQVRGNTRQ